MIRTTHQHLPLYFFAHHFVNHQYRKEEQLQILTGAIPPPPPRVKLSNIMRVLGHEAVLDPTAVARRVKEEVEERKRRHDERNKARQVSDKERKKKEINKLLEDAKLAMFSVLFVMKKIDGANTYCKVARLCHTDTHIHLHVASNAHVHVWICIDTNARVCDGIHDTCSRNA